MIERKMKSDNGELATFDEDDDGDETAVEGYNGKGSAADDGNALTGAVSVLLQDTTVRAGGQLRGKVVLRSGLAAVAAVTIRMEGVGVARLLADDGKTYTAKRVLVSAELELYQRSKPAQATTATGGPEMLDVVDETADRKVKERQLPFQFRLPADAPPSLDGNHGSIRYSCVAVVKYVAALMRNRRRRVPFRVTPPILTPMLTPSTTANGRNRVEVKYAFQSGIELLLSIGNATVERGKPIGVTVELANQTRSELNDFRMGIRLQIDWCAKGRQLTERRLVTGCAHELSKFSLVPAKTFKLEKTYVIPLELPPSIELTAESGSSSEGAAGDSSGQTPPRSPSIVQEICRVSYSLFAAVIPPTFKKSCRVEIPLKVF